MKTSKRTLPRHTLLATQGRRISSAIVDFALFLITTIIFYSFCFKPLLNSSNKTNVEVFQKEQINSGLLIDVNGKPTAITTNDSTSEFINRISYYYISYLSGNNVKEGLEPSVYKDNYNYDAIWVNEHILRLTDETLATSLFEYANNGGVDKSVVGVAKTGDEEFNTKVLSWLQEAYIAAYDDFISLDYVSKMQDKINFIVTLEFVLGAFVGAVITYVIIPLGLKKGKTLGKKINKLALANYEGYSIKDYQLVLRLIPLLLTLFALLLPLWNNTFVILAFVLVIFLSSFAFAMASPKKASLHDLVARTIVVDDAASIIFDNISEEQDYIFKEDGIEDDNVVDIVEGDGEEPEISYEK